MNTEERAAASSEFASLLKRLRTRAGLSQEMLADRARVSVQAVSALERGYRKAPYPKTLDRLVEALGVSGDTRSELESAAARARGTRLLEDGLLGRSHNLPRQLTSFLGREAVIAELRALLADAPLISVTGPGGAGKTRAVIEVGARTFSQQNSGVWFVDLAPLAGAAFVADEIAAVLGVQPSQRPALDSLAAVLGQKDALLILDNCEHVIADVRRVAATLLRACARLKILATSREALMLSGERVYRLPPLGVPEDGVVSAAEARKYGAVALFSDRALAADGRFTLTDDNAQAVVDICRRLDGLPLAIELAAARITVLSPRQLADRLQHAFELLGNSERDTAPRQRTMRAAIDWSYELLSSQPRLLFDRLAIFAGRFGLDAVTEICAGNGIEPNDLLDLLASLVDKSLVVADVQSGEARYHLLDLTRQYVLERLEARGERDALARRHALYYLEAAEGTDRAWYTAPEAAWFSDVELHLDNWRAAIDWSLGKGADVAIGQRLVAALTPVWYSTAAIEGRRWVRIALDSIDDETPLVLRALLQIADAKLQAAIGQYTASLEAARRALELLRGVDDPLQVARAQQTAGAALAALGEVSEGEALLREALATARALRNRRLAAMALGDLGTARSRGGDSEAARVFYAEALGTYGALGLHRPAASVAGNLAEVEFAAGDTEAALQRAAEALAGHNAAHNRRSAALDLCNMAAYFVALDLFDEARDHALHAFALAHDVQAPVLSLFVLQHLAAVLALRADGEPGGTRARREHAARLIGFVDARLHVFEARRERTEEREYERLMGALRASLEPNELARLMEQGAELSEERAVAEAHAA